MAVTTAADLIEASLREILVLGIQDTITSDELGDGLDALNLMLETWWTERLACFALKQESFALTSGVGSYTIGPTGVFITTRPVKLAGGFIRFNAVDYPLQMVDQLTYNRIPYKTNGGTPYILFYDAQYPDGTLYLYFVPGATGMSLFIDSYLQIQSFADLSTQISLPPGYKRAIIKNLAVEQASQYNKKPAEDLVRIAKEAKAWVKRVNNPLTLSSFDPMILGRSAGYNPWGDTWL
jgi:hypothetical protein